MTTLSESLQTAYRNTCFRVYSRDGPSENHIDLFVGEFSTPLLQLHTELEVNCSAYITAWNPHSQTQEPQTNERLQKELAATLNTSGYKTLDGIGFDPNSDWPGEASFLVPGCTLEHSREIGVMYKQNAIVWCGATAIPELIVLV